MAKKKGPAENKAKKPPENKGGKSKKRKSKDGERDCVRRTGDDIKKQRAAERKARREADKRAAKRAADEAKAEANVALDKRVARAKAKSDYRDIARG